MKSLAAALGTLFALTACAHGPTTATSATSASPATAGRSQRSAAPIGRRSPNAGTIHRGTATNRGGSQAAPPSTPASRTTPANARKPVVRAAPKPVPAPARVMPEILGASVSPTVVRSGATVSATVRTTPGVVSVVAYAGGMSMAVPRVGSGLFAGSTTLPPLPPFAHGSYAVTFVARDASGRSTQSAVGVTVR